MKNNIKTKDYLKSLNDKERKSILLPFILTALVIIIDQISKACICRMLPLPPGGTYNLGDYNFAFLEIIHVRNPGVAFSFGANWPDWLRRVMFSVVPILVLLIVCRIYLRNEDFTKLQRWSICGIIGGGFGNIIDRIFRPLGVVDFIDVKWFGLENCWFKPLRMNRWPTFNIADSAVVICGILLVISFIIGAADEKHKNTKEVAE